MNSALTSASCREDDRGLGIVLQPGGWVSSSHNSAEIGWCHRPPPPPLHDHISQTVSFLISFHWFLDAGTTKSSPWRIVLTKGIWADMIGLGEGLVSGPPTVSRQRRVSGSLPIEMLTITSDDPESSIAMILITLQLHPGCLFSESHYNASYWHCRRHQA